MVGDGTWLSVGEVVERTGLNKNQVRALADSGVLKTTRPAIFGRGTAHRRISAASVDAYLEVAKMPHGPDRDTAMEELRRRNRGGGKA